MPYQKTNTYGHLNSVMLGSYFYPEFFNSIKSAKIREPLKRISQEINEDLEYFEQVLKTFGSTVIRATQPNDRFDLDNIYIPPLQIRNCHSVINKTMYQFNQDFTLGVTDVLEKNCGPVVNLVTANEEYYATAMHLASKNFNGDILYSKETYQSLVGSDWPTYEEFVSGVRPTDPAIKQEMSLYNFEYETKELAPLQGPNIINTPSGIFVDANEYCDYATWLSKQLIDPRPIKQFTSGTAHVDGCFAVLGNNTILGIDPLIDYQSIFPDYNIIKLPVDAYQTQMEEFNLMKSKVRGKWWLAGEEHNDEFINYVETNLTPWVGYIAESIFDVNVLALDANTICVSNITPVVKEQLRQHNIDCIVIPWRHRFFVDGGLHCITLDLHRDN